MKVLLCGRNVARKLNKMQRSCNKKEKSNGTSNMKRVREKNKTLNSTHIKLLLENVPAEPLFRTHRERQYTVL